MASYENSHSEAQGPRLEDLIRPLSLDQFLHDFWQSNTPRVSENARSALRALFELPELQSVDSLVQASREDIVLFCQDGFRAMSPPDEAMACYERGDTLYLISLEQSIDPLREIRKPLADDLGIPHDSIRFEGFAARAGGVSTWHYDWDVNFQVLLQGRKTWHLAPNSNVTNPDASFVPGQNWAAEAYATDRRIQTDFQQDAITLESTAGTVLFLPRGMWHQTHSQTDCLGINFVLRPPMWHDLLTSALRDRVHRETDFREFAFGITNDGLLRSTAETTFEAQKQRLIQELQQLRINDLAFTVSSTAYAWPSGIPPQVAVLDDVLTVSSLVPGHDASCNLPMEFKRLINELSCLRHQFSLREIRWFSGDLKLDQVQSALDKLVDCDLMVVMEPESITDD